MVILICGASHTGKTLLAQKILEEYKYPYLSIDHLKMGLIRSGQTDLKPEIPDELLTEYLWQIVKEIIKTAIENQQNLVVEGCYIPFNWRDSFSEQYLDSIRYTCIIMSKEYIDNHFADISTHANVVEKRVDDSGLNAEKLKAENRRNLEQCKKCGCEFTLIGEEYNPIFKL